MKVQNFHIQKPLKKRNPQMFFSNPFFTLTQRVKVSKSSRERANTYIEFRMRKQKTFSCCGMRKSSKIFRKLYLKMIAVPAEMHFFAKR